MQRLHISRRCCQSSLLHCERVCYLGRDCVQQRSTRSRLCVSRCLGRPPHLQTAWACRNVDYDDTSELDSRFGDCTQIPLPDASSRLHADPTPKSHPKIPLPEPGPPFGHQLPARTGPIPYHIVEANPFQTKDNSKNLLDIDCA